jgi:uncharacterized membrane protein YidH (DUF202 family)
MYNSIVVNKSTGVENRMSELPLIAILVIFVGSLVGAIYSCRRFLIVDHQARREKDKPDLSGMWMLATCLLSVSTIGSLCGVLLAALILLT